MRLDARSVLLGLVALSSLPEASSRVLYGYPQAYDLDQYHNVTEVPRAVVPLKPPVNPVKPPVAPGGDKTPGSPEPAPLTPGDRTPNNNPEPAPLTPGDKPANSNPDKDKDNAIPTDEEGSRVCKRAGSCDWSDDESRWNHYSSRGREGYARVHSPGPYSTTNWGSRLDTPSRYTFRREESPDAYPHETMETMGYNDEHGFSTSSGDWDTYTSRSRHRADSEGRYADDLEPIIQASYSRGRRPRQDTTDEFDEPVGIVVHDIYGRRDRNRYQQTESNDVMTDERGRPIDQDGYADNYVPAAQQLYEGYRRSRAYDPNRPPSRYHMINENVANRDSARSIDEAFGALGTPGQRRALVRRDSEGLEQEHFNRLAGNENNYPLMNVASRNSEFRDYDLDEIELWAGPEYMMSMNYGRRPS
ncbi:hypothetical protein K458DRAFT_491196 [Lentithecium fluviatile CBS 122367]|uniref:Uncharacterized protein n=1 Tax=Lentithecium fluviatile CBS 122367 TaxID=1168545 RepID=A0A6G1IKE5_9PLEO|nr:hypothetical protein K458DRAFT_491196 [Lentithecium fluviatile CBS 122367]